MPNIAWNATEYQQNFSFVGRLLFPDKKTFAFQLGGNLTHGTGLNTKLFLKNLLRERPLVIQYFEYSPLCLMFAMAAAQFLTAANQEHTEFFLRIHFHFSHTSSPLHVDKNSIQEKKRNVKVP